MSVHGMGVFFQGVEVSTIFVQITQYFVNIVCIESKFWQKVVLTNLIYSVFMEKYILTNIIISENKANDPPARPRSYTYISRINQSKQDRSIIDGM